MNIDHHFFNDLVPLDWKKFEQSLLSPGEVYFKPGKNSKPVRILKVGDLIDNVFLGKYQLIRDQLYIKEMMDESKLLFKDFIGSEMHLARKERMQRKESFIKEFFNDIWLETNQESFETYIYSCFNTFSSFDRSILYEMEQKNQLLFRRAMVIGALGVFLSHCVDCNDYPFMKEFYNSLFCMDVGLLYPKASYHLITALKHERVKEGRGLKYLKKRKVNSKIIDQYLNHGHKSIEVIEKTWDLTFSDDKIYNIVKLHHQAPYGEGFPAKITYKQLFHWEEIGYFLDQWISFDQDCFNLEKIQNDFYKQEDKSICFNYIMQWQELIQLGKVG